MKIFNFHLMPYRHADLDAIEKNGSAWVTYSNRDYDPEKGAELYHEYLDQMEFADRLGFDGVCLNEHHQTAYGMMPIPGVLAGALARSVKRAKIAILGRALPLLNNPLVVAEEYAMLDNLTRGRFIAGFVRGIGAEYHAMGINPAQSQERFAEAHDLIIRAWTEPGPVPVRRQALPLQLREPVAAALSDAASADLDSVAGLEQHHQMGGADEIHLRADARADRRGGEVLPDVPRRGREGRLRGLARPARLVEHHLCRRDRRARRCARRKPHMEALANRFLKMPTEMLLPPGYSNIDSIKRIRAAKITGKPQTIEDLVRDRRRHRRQPEHGAREARRVSGPRRLQHLADQDPVRHAARRHDARQHGGDRAGDSAALPRPPAAGQAPGRGGVTDAFRASAARRAESDDDEQSFRAAQFLRLAGSSPPPAPPLSAHRRFAQAYPTRPVQARWCRSRPAAPPTSWRASSASCCRNGSASSSSSRTSPAAAPTSRCSRW